MAVTSTSGIFLRFPSMLVPFFQIRNQIRTKKDRRHITLNCCALTDLANEIIFIGIKSDCFPKSRPNNCLQV